MQPARRLILKLLSAAVLILGRRPVQAAPAGAATTAGDETTLRAWLATLIPEDETPGALTLGVDIELQQLAMRRPELNSLLRKGCRWLDQQAQTLAGSAFAATNDRQREAIAAVAADSEAGSLPQRFFVATHREALRRYYAHPASWEALHYHGPPQPLGFPDYAAAPERREP
jgi:hypothetical protein